MTGSGRETVHKNARDLHQHIQGADMSRFIKHILFLFAMLLSVTVGAQAPQATVYNTYLSPPYVIGEGGLAQDTVTYLNRKLAGRIELKLANVQRARLNFSTLEKENFKDAVLFTNPQFVGDVPRTRFVWTDSILEDGNAVVSSNARKFRFDGPASFDGKEFVGVAGNRYAGLEERFGKTVKRVDSTHEGTVLRKLLNNEGDVTIMARSIAASFARQPEFEGKLHIDPKPYSSFSRSILVSKQNPELATALAGVVAQMKSDAEWKAVLAKYGL
jgi:ABC-type amino acid transport substrate-binding protein